MKDREQRRQQAYHSGAGLLGVVVALLLVLAVIEGMSDRWICVLGPLGASAITLGGVFLNSRWTQQRQQVEDQQKRAALATRFLHEIQFLKSGLEKLLRTYEPGAEVTAWLQTPVYDGAGPTLSPLSLETVDAVMPFYRQIHNLRAAVQHLSTLPQQDQSVFLGDAHQQKAREILEDVLPGIVIRLRREGGKDSPLLEQRPVTPAVTEPLYESLDALRDDLFGHPKGPTP